MDIHRSTSGTRHALLGANRPLFHTLLPEGLDLSSLCLLAPQTLNLFLLVLGAPRSGGFPLSFGAFYLGHTEGLL